MMKLRIIFAVFVSLSFGGVTTVFGQNGENGEVIINTTARREVEPAYRIAEQPAIIDTAFRNPVTQYPLLSMSYEPYLEVKKIDAASVKMVEKLPQLYSGYVKLGIGSVFMPLAEAYYNNTRTRKMNYGFHGKYLGSYGTIPNYAPSQFDRTDLRGFFGVNEKKYSWNADVNYNTKGLHYYGFRNPDANKDSISQRFQTFDMKGQFASHQFDSLGVNWSGSVEYRHFNDKKPWDESIPDWHTKENYFALSGSSWYVWGSETYALDADIKYNGYRYGNIGDTALTSLDSGLSVNNTVISLRPSVTTYSKDKRLKAKLGVDVTFSVGNTNKAYLYPNAEVKYSLFDDILIPYAGVTGGLTQQTYFSLTNQNAFILSNQNLQNEHKALDGYVGIKGTLSKRMSFNALIDFSNYKNKVLFVTDTLYSAGNKFRAIYDTMNITKIEASLSYQMKEKTKVDVIGRFYSYMAKNNAYAWNLPQFQVIGRLTQNLYDKILINFDVDVEAGRKALIYDSSETDIKIENGQIAKNLGLIVDMNLGLEYRYNKRISVFLNMNNLAAQRYKRWYNYPTMGFQVMGGFTFRF